jgi:hypothetical protein
MKKKLNILTMLAILLVASVQYACTDGFTDLNKNPFVPPYTGGNQGDGGDGGDSQDPYDAVNLAKEISDDDLETLKGKEAEIGSTFKNFTYEGLVNDYQRATNLTHDIYCGYFWANNPAFLMNSPNYIYTEDWSGRRWNHFYKERAIEYKTLTRVFKYVDFDKYKNAFYITRIYFAYLMSTMTDTYGDIPMAPLVKAELMPQKAEYDKQKDIYNLIFLLLDQATKELKPGTCEFTFAKTDDKAYGGDEAKWLRFANTLRLSLALRISNVDPERAQKEGEAALAHAAGLMQDTNDRMRTVPRHAPEAMGGENNGGQENEVANCSYNYLDAVMTKFLENTYRQQSDELDPRLPICWYRPSPKKMLEQDLENHRAEYTGCPIGSSDIQRRADQYSVLKVNAFDGKVLRDDYWFGYCREFYWMGYPSRLFLEAEAALRGWAGTNGTSEELFRQGVRASIVDYYHLPASKATAYIDGLKIFSGGANPFENNDKEAALEAIITQKWLAEFPNGNEAWADFRRTDYPRVTVNMSGGDANIPLGKHIKRISYPFIEMDLNGENMPAATQGTRVWWDVADTNDDSHLGTRNVPNNFR